MTGGKLVLQQLGAFVLIAVTTLGCATARAPVTGGLYTETQGTVIATSNPAGNRVGESCAKSYLGLIAVGDASIESARRSGGITLITSVDDTAYSILGLYAKYCVIVRGR